MRRSAIAVATFLATASIAADASAVSPYAEVGIGMPELAKIRAGVLVHPRISVEAYGAAMLFNALVGVGATTYVLGEERDDLPPRHALALQGTAALNPTLRPIRLRSGGETIAAAVIGALGYAYSADSGFLFRAWLGATLLDEDGIGGGPLFTIGVGWMF